MFLLNNIFKLLYPTILRNWNLLFDQLLDLISAHLFEILFGMRLLDWIHDVVDLRLRHSFFGRRCFYILFWWSSICVWVGFRWRQYWSTNHFLIVWSSVILGECAINTLGSHCRGEFLSFSFLFEYFHISSHFRLHIIVKFLWTDSSYLILNCILFYILNWVSNDHRSIKTCHLLLICIFGGLIPPKLELFIVSFRNLLSNIFSDLLRRDSLL